MSIKEIENLKQIKYLEKLIYALKVPEFNSFKCSNDTYYYYNKPGLCGIVYNNNKWIWCHQNYFPIGDNPNLYYSIIPFNSLNDLIKYVETTLILKFKLINKQNKDDI